VAKKEAQAPLEFEPAMAELEALIARMEQGEFSLEESIKQFERGMVLARGCQQALAVAEQKVRILLGTGADAALEEFVPPDEN
jgi:exodeoxyribonuclease VII small subunit